MRLSSSLLGAVLAATVYACNPTQGKCSPVTALASSFREDFHLQSSYFEEVKATGLSYSNDGLKLEIAKRFDNPSIKSNFYIMFGKVEVVMQAAKGKGIVSSFYLQSDDLDEIDIELFGGDAYEFQSNWFSKGDTTTYDRGEYHSTSNSPLENFHTYTIEWTKDSITWSLDGSVVRTLEPDNGQGFPQSPMYIMAGTWAGGDPSNEPGTIEWAGGLTDYSEAPFDMYIQSVIVADYSTGSEYEYTDTSGEWTSIKAIDGEVNGRESQALKDFDTLQNGGSVSNAAKASSSQLKTSSSSTVVSLQSASTFAYSSESSSTAKSSLSSSAKLTSSYSTSLSTTLLDSALKSASSVTSLKSTSSLSAKTTSSFVFFNPYASISALDILSGKVSSATTTSAIHQTGLGSTSILSLASSGTTGVLQSTLLTITTLPSTVSLAIQQENLGSRKAVHWFALLVFTGYLL